MEKIKIDKVMENINLPEVEVPQHQREFRVRLLNTKKSTIGSTLFLILPFLFLTGVLFKHYLKLDFWLFTGVFNFIGELDSKYGDQSILNWVFRFLLLAGPPLAVLVSIMGILHLRYDKLQKELIIGLKIKWVNISIILSASLIFIIFFTYLIFENA